MTRLINILFCVAFLCLSITQPITSKRSYSGSHNYPKSGGLSGGGHSGHSYPSSGGLSGNSHGYPSSGSSHGYPSSGGSHGYPSSGGSHGYPSSGGLSGNSHSHPSSGSSYPSNTGSHGYPSGKGLSGNSPSNTVSHTTNIHHHYNYSPPQKITYTPVSGGPPMSYPVYHGAPPTYVYQYKNSGSKYGTLLAGLALLNLGTLAGTAYALNSNSHSNYKPQPGEICKFGVKKDNGDYEETKIDCQLITSFIFQEEAKASSGGTNVTVVTTVTNVTTTNLTNGEHPTEPPVNRLYEMLPNGTLVPRNETFVNNTNVANNTGDSTLTSSVTITTTNTTTVSNALDVKGKEVEVTPGMQCYVIRHTPSSNMKKSVGCGLLQSYAQQSLKKNSASRNVPLISFLSIISAIIFYY